MHTPNRLLGNSNTPTGRFAPSPTGYLHLGSLLTSLASFIYAKQNNSHWFVRIDDLDAQRCLPQYASSIIQDLKLVFEKPFPTQPLDVVFQSTRLSRYQEALNFLIEQGQVFYCTCSRQQLHSVVSSDAEDKNTICQCHRQTTPPKQAYAVRLYSNRLRNGQHITPDITHDFILQRKDKVFAYHLACVLDDALDGVTEIVRGADLIDVAQPQQELMDILSLAQPKYYYMPIITNTNGDKLSKQNHAAHYLKEVYNDNTADPVKLAAHIIKALLLLRWPKQALTEAPEPTWNIIDIFQWAITWFDVAANSVSACSIKSKI